MTHKASGRRSYLPRDQRRLQLLESAAGIVDKQGWDALTMITLAEAAGTSRQLVYQYFDSVTDLVEQTISHLFKELFSAIQREFDAGSHDIIESARQVHTWAFELPPGRINALWEVLSAPFDKRNTLGGAGRKLRRQFSRIAFQAIAREAIDLPEVHRDLVARTFDLAFWSSYLAVTDGVADKESAIKTYVWLVDRVLHGDRAKFP